MSGILRLRRAAPLMCALAWMTACNGSPGSDAGTSCGSDGGQVCGPGFVCDEPSGVCVAAPGDRDMTLREGDSLLIDGGSTPTCDERLRAGAFPSSALLASASSSAEESSLSLSADGTRLYFASDRNGPRELFSASVDPTSPLASSPASLVTLSDAAVVTAGGALTKDGAYWLAGTKTGVTRLYRSTQNGGPLSLTLEAPVEPVATSCAFSDPFFELGDALGDLYLSYPLSGCAGQSIIATGRAGRQLGAFYGSMATTEGHRLPTLSPSALTLISSTVAAPARLDYAVRPSRTLQFSGPTALPLSALGSTIVSAHQLVVRADCRVAYLVAERSGGLGGTDLWALEIAP